MAAIVLFVGFVMYYAVSRILIQGVEDSLVRFAEQGATTIHAFLDGRLSELESISENSIVKNTALPAEQRLDELGKQLKLENYRRLSITDANGNAQTTDGMLLHVADRDYFKKAMNGVANVSDPLVSRADGTVVIVFATPIKAGEKVTGVLYATYDADVLSKMTDQIKINSKGSAFMLDRFGYTIAHPDRKLVYNKDNDFNNIKTDPSLKQLVELERKMVAGKSGTGEYTYNGTRKYMGYCPVGDTGWSIAVTSPKSVVLGLLNTVTAILILFVLGVTVLISLLFSNSKELQLNLSKQKFNSLRITDVTNLIVFTIDMDGSILTKNDNAGRLFRAFERNGAGPVSNLYELLSFQDSEKLKDLIVSAHLQSSSASFELALRREESGPLHLYCSMSGENESKISMEIMGLDITERVESQNRLQDSFEELTAVYGELEEKEEGLRANYEELQKVQKKLMISENRYQLAMEGANDAIWDWDAGRNEFFYSEKFFEMIGSDPEEMGRQLKDILFLVHPEDKEKLSKELKKFVAGEKPALRSEIRMRAGKEEYRWFFVKGKAVFNENGNIVRAAGSFTDINDRKTQEQMIRSLAYTDSLTSLPNRAAFYNKIDTAIATYESSNQCALIYMDIDNYKYVNDSFSHYIGDLLLFEIAKRLKESISADEFIARLEGDEFVIFVSRMDSMEILDAKIRMAMSAFDEPFVISGNTFHITASCGVSIYPDHGTGIEEMLKNADMAMYQAKKDGKHKYSVFEKSMNEELIQRIDMENGLRRAISNHEFVLHYQPQVDLVTGRITGFEALIRWQGPEGLIPPLRFIGVAEETGLIVSIGHWVLKTACTFVKQLNNTFGTNLGISVNVSVIQLLQADFVWMVQGVLKETGLDPKLLELELTESRLMETVEMNLQKLAELRESGIRISIDDFGKGFSSLSYLKQLPINSLKIDKSFVDDIQNEGNSMIESIIHIGHQRGLEVIAEGVEKKEQLDYLSLCNCDKVQGYYYSRPVPETDVIGLLK